MSDAPDRSALIGLVDELARRREENERRTQEEVPVLTDVVEGEQPLDALEAGAQSLAKEIEHEVLRQITPQLHDIVRRAVRTAIWHALVGGRRGSNE